jgi:hypothetical protein
MINKCSQCGYWSRITIDGNPGLAGSCSKLNSILGDDLQPIKNAQTPEDFGCVYFSKYELKQKQWEEQGLCIIKECPHRKGY